MARCQSFPFLFVEITPKQHFLLNLGHLKLQSQYYSEGLPKAVEIEQEPEPGKREAKPGNVTLKTRASRGMRKGSSLLIAVGKEGEGLAGGRFVDMVWLSEARGGGAN